MRGDLLGEVGCESPGDAGCARSRAVIARALHELAVAIRADRAALLRWAVEYAAAGDPLPAMWRDCADGGAMRAVVHALANHSDPGWLDQIARMRRMRCDSCDRFFRPDRTSVGRWELAEYQHCPSCREAIRRAYPPDEMTLERVLREVAG